jgi:hypothetical protein
MEGEEFWRWVAGLKETPETNPYELEQHPMSPAGPGMKRTWLWSSRWRVVVGSAYLVHEINVGMLLLQLRVPDWVHSLDVFVGEDRVLRRLLPSGGKVVFPRPFPRQLVFLQDVRLHLYPTPPTLRQRAWQQLSENPTDSERWNYACVEDAKAELMDLLRGRDWVVDCVCAETWGGEFGEFVHKKVFLEGSDPTMDYVALAGRLRVVPKGSWKE